MSSVWRVKSAWIGVKRRIEDKQGVLQDEEFLGVIIRSGTVRQCGHFCSVEIQVNGVKYTASGAEDRIFPFHSIVLRAEEKVPKLELVAIGWCLDGNTYAFRNKHGEVVKLIGPGKDGEKATEPIVRSRWPKSLPRIGKKLLFEEIQPGIFQEVVHASVK